VTTVTHHGPTLQARSTMMMGTPRGPVESNLHVFGDGLGQWVFRFTGFVEVCVLAAPTPVDEGQIELRFASVAPASRAHDRLTEAFAEELERQVDQDIPIWEHKVYRAVPLLTAGDATIPQVRAWARQFLA
jgi:hypothetical protein